MPKKKTDLIFSSFVEAESGNSRKMAIRYSILTLGSFVLTGLVVTNAFYQKQQFYPSVVYLTKSNPSMAVLYVQAFVFVLLLGKVVQKLLFGQLRAAESEHLMEKAWYAITETCLAFTVFRDDFSPKFVAQFTFLLFLKCFHWLAEDRVDYMERSPIITILFHVRMMAVVAILSALDSYYVSHAYFTTLLKGASVQIVFGFEYAILLTIVFHIAIKYVLHSIDLRNAHPWDNKAVYLLYTELVIDFIRVLLYTIFMVVMMRLHTFPLFSIRPMYLTLRAFKKALNDALLSRRAINYMNTVYPDATAEELRQGDNVCIICREEMHGVGAKKLPCNHIFHASCLRSWFQRQQTCPTCRLDILRMTHPSTANFQQQRQQAQQPGAGAAQPQQPPAAGGQPQAPNQIPPGPGAPNQPHPHHRGMPQLPQLFPMIPSGFFVAPNAQQQPPQQQGNASNPSTSGESSNQPSTSATNETVPPPPPFGFLPPAPFMPPTPPFMLPFPPAPNFNGLNDDEVRRMEGSERRAVEARIQCLQNIQTLLDAAVVQLQQYTSILTTLSTSPQFREAIHPAPAPVVPTSSSEVQFNLGATADVDDGPSPSSSSNNLRSSAEPDGASTSNDPQDDVRLRRLHHFEKKRQDSNASNN